MTGLPVAIEHDASWDGTVVSVTMGASAEAPLEIVSCGILWPLETASRGRHLRLSGWLGCYVDREDVTLATTTLAGPASEPALDAGLVPAY